MHHRSLIVFFASLACACSATELDTRDAGSEGGGIFTGDSGSPPPGDGSVMQKSTAFVRLAALAPPLGSIDFCLRAKDATYWDGPFFFTPKADGGEGGAPPAAPFPGVSRYVQVPANGATDVAIVPAGQSSCLTPKLTGMITIDPNKRLTIAVMGATKDSDAGTRGLGISTFVDDTVSKPSSARLRVIHGALGTDMTPGYGNLQANLAYGNMVQPFASVAPRQASTPSNQTPKVDALGYSDIMPISELASLRFVGTNPQGGPWSTQPSDLGLVANAVRTAFLYSDDKMGVILCSDLPSGGDAPCTQLLVK